MMAVPVHSPSSCPRNLTLRTREMSEGDGGKFQDHCRGAGAAFLGPPDEGAARDAARAGREARWGSEGYGDRVSSRRGGARSTRGAEDLLNLLPDSAEVDSAFGEKGEGSEGSQAVGGGGSDGEWGSREGRRESLLDGH